MAISDKLNNTNMVNKSAFKIAKDTRHAEEIFMDVKLRQQIIVIMTDK